MKLLTVLLLLVCAATLCEANLAAMSVDMGSQFMKIGLVKPGVPMEIVLNTESRRKTPTIVALRNGERFFGDVAAQMSVKYPTNAITFAIDLIGKQFENPIVAKYQRDFPHLKLVPHPERNTVVFEIDNKSYDIEAILAMLLWNAREQTQTFADQPVKDVLITVPSYFNQAERTAVAAATKIAGLKLLSIMSEGSAAALNYGVFRRKDITEKPQNLLIYDVGASKTVATLVEYRLENKEPQLKVLGIGFDRTMGGREFTERLRDHLVEEFRKKHKTKTDITTNPRAMAKLWKEAERVKQVLSANADHFAQVESLFEDKDFKVKVSRELIEQFVEDFRPRLMQPIDDALKTIDFTSDQVETVVLMGAGTRIPAIQQLVKDYFGGRELARFLNTDEAIALGAVYEAAHLSKGFRVKPFEVHDLMIYPIQVRFTGFVNRTQEDGEVVQVKEEIIRDIYPHLSRMPGPRKTVTFTSHRDDFTFYVQYGNLDHLTEKQRSEFGDKKLMEVHVKGVQKALEKNSTGDNAAVDYKFNGIKAVFKFSRYGAVKVDTAELTLEHVEPAKNSTLSAIVDKLGSIFSSSKDPAPEEEGEASTESATTEAPSETDAKNETADAKSNNETSIPANNTANETLKNTTIDAKPPAIKPPPKFIRTSLPLDTLHAYTTLSSKQISESTRVLGDFEKAERARRDHEAASNGLESLVYDTAVKLEEEWLARKDFVTDFKAIDQEVKELKTWMEDNIAGADVQTLRKKRDKLAGLIRAVHQKERKQKEDKLKKERIRRIKKKESTRRWFLEMIKTNKFTPIPNISSSTPHSEL